MRDLTIATAPRRDSRHWEAGTVSWAELLSWAEQPAATKESGNYLLGVLEPDTTVTHKGERNPCTGLHRRKRYIVSRSGITLDADTPTPGFADKVQLIFPYAALLHTTYSHSPDDPHYRLIVPTDREMDPEEYVAAAGSLVQLLGPENFDPSTCQPERYMFRPAAAEPEWYGHWVLDGQPAPVERLLKDYEEDLSALPVPEPNRTKRDPLKLGGVVGAFNRAYDDLDELIAVFGLPYTQVSEDRYQLVGALSQAGFGPVNGVDGLYFSHHSNDPAYGQTCSAFDLVRLHRFGEMDEEAEPRTPLVKLPSHEAMSELASHDPRVIADLVGADFDDELDETAEQQDWRLGLRLAPRSGKPLDIVQNWDLLAENDPVFQQLYFNIYTMSAEFSGERVPWRAVTDATRIVTGVDRFEFGLYLDREYRLAPSTWTLNGRIDAQAAQTQINPVREYLAGLSWDGVPRVETCLPGVRPTDFTRLVARKSLVAAVARAFEPGIKWDHTLVLYGEEGLGKTWWIDKMSRGYSSTLGRVGDKDTLLAMQRCWIMVADEGHSLRKSDADEQKEFLTRTSDLFRAPYDRETLAHPRHCVIWSTTNDETFLRNQKGNRRFLIVECEQKVDFAAFNDDYVDQVWAEAVQLYRNGELLFLDEPESKLAASEREPFIEEDTLQGMIQEFLDTPLPADWWDRPLLGRTQWINDRDQGFEAPGDTLLSRTCSLQIWVEALGRRLGDQRRTELLAISNALKNLPGWHAVKGRTRMPGYGPQLVFERDEP